MSIDYSPTTNGDWLVYYRREINTWQISYHQIVTDSNLMYPVLQICTNIDQSGQHWAEDYGRNTTQKEGEEISTTCSAKGGNLSVGWGMRPREDKAGGERKVWLRGVLAGEWMTQWGEECRCRPRPEICGNSGVLQPPAPSPYHPQPPPTLSYNRYISYWLWRNRGGKYKPTK